MNLLRNERFAGDSRCHYNALMPRLLACSPAGRLRHFFWLLIAGVMVLAPPVSALPGDSEQPVRITTDEALRDEKTGETVYQGNVELVQGTIKITADKITFYRIDEEGEKIVAEGSPARMQQQPEPESALMHARGDTIEYYRSEARVHLRDNAQVEQDGSTVRGDRIDYFINQQLVKAVAGESDTSRRVEVVIPPHKLEE